MLFLQILKWILVIRFLIRVHHAREVAEPGPVADALHDQKAIKRGTNMFAKRQGLIIWLYNLKNTKMLRRFGNVHFVSKRMKYAVIYCNQSELEDLSEKLESLPFVKRVEPSYKPFLKTEFENAKPDKAKEYDYRLGL